MSTPPPSDELLLRIAEALERFSPPSAPASKADAVAWRWTRAGPVAIERIDWVAPDRLVGVEDALEPLEANTARFVAGKPANDVLLWGDRGTGKSSLIRAMLTRHHAGGLRLIALEQTQFEAILAIADWVAGRPEKYILFLDDLSFTGVAAGFNELKGILEGGLSARPANLLVYATSNRRHLLAEFMSENEPQFRDGEIHPQESVQERIALSDRFGLRIGLYTPDQATYLAIVDRYLEQYGFHGDRGAAHRDALRFALQAGNRSGRAAHQFVRSLDL